MSVDKVTIGPNGQSTITSNENVYTSTKEGVELVNGEAQNPVTVEAPPAKPEEKPTTDGRPAWLPPNFKTVEDYNKSYTEQQRKITELSEQVKQLAPPVDPAKSEQTITEKPPTDAEKEQAAQAVAKLDETFFEKFSSEYSEKGELSEDSFKELADKGIPVSVAKTHIAGMNALADYRDSQVLEVFNGKDQFDVVAEWARANVDAEAIARFDQAVRGLDIEAAKDQARALMSRYTEANGYEPGFIQGGEGTSNTGKVYASNDEMVADMKDERYKNPRLDGGKFQKEVHEKVKHSENVMKYARDVSRSGNY